MRKQDDRFLSLDHPIVVAVNSQSDGGLIAVFKGTIMDFPQLLEAIAEAYSEADAAVAA